MSQAFTASYDVPTNGTYLIRAERLGTTDLLSLYVNRVRKASTADKAASYIETELALKAGDLVESTGALVVKAKG